MSITSTEYSMWKHGTGSGRDEARRDLWGDECEQMRRDGQRPPEKLVAGLIRLRSAHFGGGRQQTRHSDAVAAHLKRPLVAKIQKQLFDSIQFNNVEQ